MAVLKLTKCEHVPFTIEQSVNYVNTVINYHILYSNS